MDIEKKPYEISVWEDRLVYVTNKGEYEKIEDVIGTIDCQYFKEKKIAIIGSNTMNTPFQAFAPKLICNTNGSSSLTFSIFYRYYDQEVQDFLDNPFIPLLSNERKIKLRYGNNGDTDCRWYDFVIKNIQEDSKNYTFTYTAEDVFVNELSKSGFDLEFDSKLENNCGTLNYLGNKILEGSDWQLSAEIAHPKEYKDEPLYAIFLSKYIKAKNLLDNSELEIPANKFIYASYSDINEKKEYVQFIYNEAGKYPINDKSIIDLEGCNYQVKVDNYNSGAPDFAKSIKVSDTYRGNILVIAPITKYDKKIDKYVKVYTNSKGEGEYYGFEKTEYITSDYVQNYVVNGTNFSTTEGWRSCDTDAASESLSLADLKTTFYPDIFKNPKATDFASYLVANFKNSSQIISNSSFFTIKPKEGFSTNQEYILRIDCGQAGENGNYIPAQSCPFKIVVSTYSTNEKGKTKFVDKVLIFKDFIREENFFISRAKVIKKMSKEDMLNTSIATFLIPNGLGEIAIKDFEIFNFLKKGNSYVVPGEEIEAKIQTHYFYYNPIDQYSKIEEIPFLYEGITPSSDYIPKYNNSDDKDAKRKAYEKIRTIQAKETNRLNLIQMLCEKFETWVRFYIERNAKGQIEYEDSYTEVTPDMISAIEKSSQQIYAWSQNEGRYIPITDYTPEMQIFLKGRRQKKTVQFFEYKQVTNSIGFKYGINLKEIKRKIDSAGYISKIVVKDNTNTYGQGGFCSIARAEENPSGENFLYDFSYYIGQKLLDFSVVTNDLYTEGNGWLGYYKKIKQINQIEDAQIEEKAALFSKLSDLESAYKNYQNFLDQAKKEREKLYFDVEKRTGMSIDELIASDSSWKEDETIRSFVYAEKNLTIKINNYTKLRDNSKKELTAAEERVKEYDELLKTYKKKKLSLNKKFYEKYSRFIQEGSWISEDYLDDTLYYLDANRVLHTAAQPKVSYTIEVLELSALEDYQNYNFSLGDKTFIEDTEFFGWQRNPETGIYSPAKEEIIVTGMELFLDSPEQNKIKVQNYKTQFEDLFQRITATTQSLELNRGGYGKVSNIINEQGNIKPGVIQSSIINNSFIVSNSKDQTVFWDNTGITAVSPSAPNEMIRIVSGGVFLSIDGGLTWNVGVTGRGINASYITAGQIDTNLIRIMNGNYPSFTWDNLGLNAYSFDLDSNTGLGTNFNNAKFIRFDQFGLYGINGTSAFNPLVPDVQGGSIGEAKIKEQADFSLTWSGFRLRSRHQGEGKKGYISISSENDFEVFDNEEKQRIKIGLLSVDPEEAVYGIKINRISETKGVIPVIETSSDGNVWIRDQLLIGEQESVAKVSLGYLDQKGYSGNENAHQVINANQKFKVYEDGHVEAESGVFKGRVEASEGEFHGNIYAEGGKIGNLTIEQVEQTIDDNQSVEITSEKGFIFKISQDKKVTPEQLTLKLNLKGITPGTESVQWSGSNNGQQWIPFESKTKELNILYSQLKFINGTYFIKVEYINTIKTESGSSSKSYTDFVTINEIIDGTNGKDGATGESAISYQIDSSNGYLINETSGIETTDLKARVFQGDIELDSAGEWTYHWEENIDNSGWRAIEGHLKKEIKGYPLNFNDSLQLRFQVEQK